MQKTHNKTKFLCNKYYAGKQIRCEEYEFTRLSNNDFTLNNKIDRKNFYLKK